jgi:hypothetical protein
MEVDKNVAQFGYLDSIFFGANLMRSFLISSLVLYSEIVKKERLVEL